MGKLDGLYKFFLARKKSFWTEEKFTRSIRKTLNGRKLIILSDLEPYIHTKDHNTTTYHHPAGGVITTIDSLLKTTGGEVIARGIGNADRDVVDSNDSLKVPPDKPLYTLKRVWLTKEEEQMYSLNFLDQGLYLLFHAAYEKPIFSQEGWELYKKINQRFAEAVLSSISEKEKAVVFIQDFQFCLVAQYIKEMRPDVIIGTFWHISWVAEDVFRIFPWRRELLEGLLYNDFIGFHTKYYRENFLQAVEKETLAQTDKSKELVICENHKVHLASFPVGIPFTGAGEHAVYASSDAEKLLVDLNIKTQYIGLGVDRLDYIKGIPEKLRGLETFLEKYPSYVENFTFIQLCSLSETPTERYNDFVALVKKEIGRINKRFQTEKWKPIVFLTKVFTKKELQTFFCRANFCFIASLQEGLNLVGEEYVAARNDEKGVLVLSKFAGLAEYLDDAVVINPYDSVQIAQGINTALTMSQEDQQKRMRRMREVIANYNLYHWSEEMVTRIVQAVKSK